MVRSDGAAAAHQGARYLCASVLSGRQARLSEGSASRARLRARGGGGLSGNGGVRAIREPIRGWGVLGGAGPRRRMRYAAAPNPHAAMILAAGRGERMRPL